MKIALHSKFPAFLIGIFILIQSCTVYHSASVDIEDAVQSQNKVKVLTNTSKTYKFKKIIAKDNLYYGIAKANRNSNLVYSDKEKIESYFKNLNSYPLEIQNIKGIYTKNRVVSTILSIGMPVILITTAIIVIGESVVSSIAYDEF